MSSHDTLITGRLPRPQPLSLLAARGRHARVLPRERHFELADRAGCDGDLVLRAFAADSASSFAGALIMKLPAGTTTISGQSAQSLKLSPGFATDRHLTAACWRSWRGRNRWLNMLRRHGTQALQRYG